MVSSIDRLRGARGAILGLAVCDALGAPFEFSERQPGVTSVADFQAGGPHNLPAGYWTDDTAMALCIAQSLLQTQEFDPRDQLERYLRWQEHGYMSSTGSCFDIGIQTQQALAAFRVSGICGAVADESKSGNGSIMRLAPVPLAYVNNPRRAVECAGYSSVTTHGSPQCVAACRYLAYLMVQALTGKDKTTVLDGGQFRAFAAAYFPLPQPIEKIIDGSYKTLSREQVQTSGWVVHTLEAALWALHTTSSFEEGAVLIPALGGDTDTVGAVYGQLAGALYGVDAIPARWLDGIAHRPLLEGIAVDLHRKAHPHLAVVDRIKRSGLWHFFAAQSLCGCMDKIVVMGSHEATRTQALRVLKEFLGRGFVRGLKRRIAPLLLTLESTADHWDDAVVQGCVAEFCQHAYRLADDVETAAPC